MFSLCCFRLTPAVTLRRAVCALITRVVSTASELFRPGRSDQRKVYPFLKKWNKILFLIFPVPLTDQGSSAATTAPELWCWRETLSVAAAQTGPTTGARLLTGNHHGCRVTPTGSTMSWVSNTAASGPTTATSTSTIDPPAAAAATNPRRLVRAFWSQMYLYRQFTTFWDDQGPTRWLKSENQAQNTAQ